MLSGKRVMDDQLSFVVDLVAALSIALAGGWLAARLRLSPTIGYVAAGVIISPLTPGFVGDAERLRLIADVGVVLLLFGIGVQFSLRELVSAGRTTTALGLGQVAGTLGLGYLAGIALGWGSDQALFFGAAVAQSSSTVMAKLVTERGEEEARHSRIALTWSVAQDLSTILLVVLLGVATEGDTDPGEVGLTGLKVVGFLAGVLIIGVRIVPWALEQVVALQSRELFLLAIASLALGTAAAASSVGISLALGAFLAGLVVSESDRSHQVLGEMLPVREVFGVLFFVAFGMLIDFGELGGGFHVFAIALLLIVGVKFAFVAGPMLLLRTPVRTALLAAALLAQSAELTFIVLDAGVANDVVSERVFSLTLTAAAASILLVPGLLALAERAPAAPLWAPAEAQEELGEIDLINHAVVSGYRSGGSYVATALRARGFKVMVVDEDRRLIEQLRSQEIPCLVGNASNQTVLERLNLRRARLLIVFEPDPILAEMAVRRSRAIHPGLDVLARAGSAEERVRLLAAGARQVVVAEQEAALEVAMHALIRYGIDRTQAAAIVQRMRGPAV
jgi:CPA2 family monovalent cation:H+ antiporter-2